MTGRMTLALIALIGAAIPAQAAPSQALISYLRSGNDSRAVDTVKEKGATAINQRGHDGETPLTVATRLRKLPHLAVMLDAGGDPDFANRDGDTPLIIASRIGWSEGMKMLLESNADANMANRKGETALIAAVQSRNVAAVRALLARGADPDKRDHVAGMSARDYARRDDRVRDLARMIDTARPPKK